MAHDDWDFTKPWYHGSPLEPRELTELRVGSSITQDRDTARVFSHKPTLMGASGTGWLKHDGTSDGYLYRVAEAVTADDVVPHPHPINRDRWEWLIQREMRVELIECTTVRDEERYTDAEIADIRRIQAERGEQSFMIED